MSVLIRGMTMPKNCCDCPCFNEFGYHFCNLDDERRDVYYSKPEWCPLVELPEKHGRLIDADKMVKIWKGCAISGDITPLIDARPTVIEAEDK